MEQTKEKSAVSHPVVVAEYAKQGITKAEYARVHRVINKENQKTGTCKRCQQNTGKRTEWSLNHGKLYTTDISNYEELCVRCHREKDATEEYREACSKRLSSQLLAGRAKITSTGRLGYLHNSAKPILQFTKQGTFVKEWGSAIDAVRSLGITNQAHLCNSLNGRKKSAHGYVWKYKNNTHQA